MAFCLASTSFTEGVSLLWLLCRICQPMWVSWTPQGASNGAKCLYCSNSVDIPRQLSFSNTQGKNKVLWGRWRCMEEVFTEITWISWLDVPREEVGRIFGYKKMQQGLWCRVAERRTSWHLRFLTALLSVLLRIVLKMFVASSVVLEMSYRTSDCSLTSSNVV